MRSRDQAPVDVDRQPDPHSLLFGPDDEFDPGFGGGAAGPAGPPGPGSGGRHAAGSGGRRGPGRTRRRGRRVVWTAITLCVLVVAAAAWIIAPRVEDLVNPPDYSGSGTGTVRVTVATGDSAADIARTLQGAGVVKSARAFVDAAAHDRASQNIQPGTYVLRAHMSAGSALRLILEPSSRASASDVLVTEGATEFDVVDRLTKALGGSQRAAVEAAVGNVAALGVPLGYAPASGPMTSVEGFLFPATYPIEPGTRPIDALQKMTARFAEEDRSIGFAKDAKKLGLTPYQALIVASLAQSEAKYPADMAKVARVVLNRLKAGWPLKVDATTRYGARVKGVDPDTVDYASFDTPYNSYTHDGLPPTPISNPGEQALKAAVDPPAGNWMYYVNGDAEGHLFFTDSESAFTTAVATCRERGWGCG